MIIGSEFVAEWRVFGNGEDVARYDRGKDFATLFDVMKALLIRIDVGCLVVVVGKNTGSGCGYCTAR